MLEKVADKFIADCYCNNLLQVSTYKRVADDNRCCPRAIYHLKSILVTLRVPSFV